MRLKLLDRKGFSLVELLVSTAILSYAASAILVGFINNMELAQDGRNLTRAMTHADYVLEDIRHTSFGTIITLASSGNWNWDATALSSRGLNPLKNESINTSTTGSNPLEITISVSWTDFKERSQTRILKTLVSG